MSEYYCGPQRWPKWLRKPLSRYYNRACRIHDNLYEDTAVDRLVAEQRFKTEVTRRRQVLRKAWQRGKITLPSYLIHSVIVGNVMPWLTLYFGKAYRKTT